MTMLVLTHRLFEAVTAFRAGSWVASANRSPITEPAPAEMVYPLVELDRMLPQCDTVLIACALAPETRGLIDARRLALLKPGTLVINVGRAAIVDEDALYDALKDGHLGGAALDVWWQYPTAAEPNRRPSRRPFHELPNVLMTPHSSSSSDAKRNGAGAWWPPISIASRGASRSKKLYFRPERLSRH
jgi:phosphoglycerate dehydrogenase-like enzyme